MVSVAIDLSGKVALVTGASRGIGRAIAERFSAAGAAVAIHYNRGREGAVELVESIHARRGRAAAVGGDLREPEAVERLFGEAAAKLGDLDILVNNAGSYPLHDLLDAPASDWKTVVETNLVSVHLCTRAAGRALVARGAPGAIVNVSSIEALRPAPAHSHYTAAKAGVLAYTRSSAFELGRHGIRVNAVSPGLIWREGIEESWPEGVRSFRERAPLARVGRPEDVANACLFLASPLAAFITGANLLVDGGVLQAPAF